MDFKVWILLGSLAGIILFAIPPIRYILGGVCSALLTPAVLGLLKQLGLWLLWILKKLFMAHFELLKNFVTPRKVLFRSLEDEDPYKL
jgi:hypothetical protein